MTIENDKSQQGASYPYVALANALGLSDAVKQLGGNKTPVPKSLLASTLKEDEKSQGFTFRIASAKCFGLIEGRSSYTLTEIAKRYYFPTSDSDKVEASLLFLSSPSGFAEIIKRFDGQKIPETKMLSNIFHTQYRVPESWSLRAAQFFVRSAQKIGVIDEQGFLRFDAAKHGASTSTNEKLLPPHPPEKSNPPTTSGPGDSGVPNPMAPNGYHSYELPLANNRKVTILSPLDITPQEIKRLNKWTEFTLQVNWSGEEKEGD
ncbi:MAG: hypothetical protein M3Y82_02810 [Verrucomicrobiota bacterium]|nr:hypothetical protein [Verrucomicrobiota bacterium]